MTTEALSDKIVEGEAPLDAERFCPSCGYSLRGIESPRCPECGFELPPPGEHSVIPWSYRARLGRLRALRRTVRLVTFRNREFCAAMLNPVSYRDAQRFRGACVIIASLSLLWVFGIAAGFSRTTQDSIKETGWPVYLAEVVGAIAVLFVVTGLPSYFFHPRCLSIESQNRALALSYYSAAPLYGSPLAALLVAGGFLTGLADRQLGALLVMLGTTVAAVLIAVWWFNLVRIAHRVLRRKRLTAVVALLTPLLWLIAVPLIALGIPWLVFYIEVIAYSLT